MKIKLKSVLYFLLLSYGLSLGAQKIGYVDTKYLLENNQEYIEAKKYMKNQIETWDNELKQMKDEYEKEKSSFLNEKILLTKEQIIEIEKKIEEKKQKITDFEKGKYGPEGELVMSQLTIINPIQNKIWNSIQTISKRRGLSIILDKGSESGPTIIFSDPRYDITSTVLDYMNNPNKKQPKKVVEPKTKQNKEEEIKNKKETKEKDKNKTKNIEEDVIEDTEGLEEKDLLKENIGNKEEAILEKNIEVKTDNPSINDGKIEEKKKNEVKNKQTEIKEEKKPVKKTLSERIKEIQKNKNK